MYDDTNTLLVDDTEIKATYSDNIYCPEEWTIARDDIKEELGREGKIRKYLDALLMYEGDVKEFVKQHRKQ